MKQPTKCYRVHGPAQRVYAVWDHGDELCVTDGPNLTDNVVARVRPELVQRISVGGKRQLIESACGSIHTARLMEEMGMAGEPSFKLLWGR